MGTTRLYYDDPFLLNFEARLIAHREWQGAAAVVLDRSAFYPEAGGQLGDHGELGGVRVTDVQVDDEGVVHHLIAGEPPPVGTEVRGVIDRDRRRVHMSLHTAQHMLSRALANEARADTVSARLGETGCTIDVDREAIDERDLARAESVVNAVIDDDVHIRAFFPTLDELEALPLRRAPKVTENIRVIDVGGFDVTPCGGTHCTRSSQVGLVSVSGVERYKGKVRVSFTAGARARADLGAQAELLKSLAHELTCGPKDVGGAVDKLRRELSAARDALGNARARLAENAANQLLASADLSGATQIVAVFDDETVDFLRGVASRITARPDTVAFLAARAADGINVLVARGAASTFDCGGFLKRAAASCGGRGGGRQERAEGRVPQGVDWQALVDATGR